MSDYTPDEPRLRNAYIDHADFVATVHGTTSDDRQAMNEFDRGIAKIKAQALTDLADQMRDRFAASWIRGKARELTHGPQKTSGAFAVTESEQDDE